MSRAKIARYLALIAVIAITDMLYGVIAGKVLDASFILLSLMTGVMLGSLLTWLLTRIGVKPLHALILTWINLYVVMFLSNIVEAYFFTTIFSRVEVLAAAIIMPIPITLAEAAMAAIILPAGDRSLLNLIRSHLSSRNAGSWAWRIAVSAVAYLLVYFFFGMLIYPFVAEYYSDSTLGLRVPGFELIVPLEILRGLLYVAALFPIIASLSSDHKSSFIAVFLMLFLVGGFIPLLSRPSIPPEILPFHTLEILADSLVYGFILSKILAAGGSSRNAGKHI
ncbi:MAG: hypothetical protein QW330_02885 [Nitrososphaerota archaeon]